MESIKKKKIASREKGSEKQMLCRAALGSLLGTPKDSLFFFLVLLRITNESWDSNPSLLALRPENLPDNQNHLYHNKHTLVWNPSRFLSVVGVKNADEGMLIGKQWAVHKGLFLAGLKSPP